MKEDIKSTIARLREEIGKEPVTSRAFWLVREEDESGVSGTGVVADGVVFPDGTAVLRWRTMGGSTGVYNSLEELEAIHGHGGKTKAVFIADAHNSLPMLLDALEDAMVRAEAEKDSKDRAYKERNQLVALLSKIWPSHLAKHPESDGLWERDWMNIVFIDSPMGQLSWHLHDSDLPTFSHLQYGENTWDGHGTEEKYSRIAAYHQAIKSTKE